MSGVSFCLRQQQQKILPADFGPGCPVGVQSLAHLRQAGLGLLYDLCPPLEDASLGLPEGIVVLPSQLDQGHGLRVDCLALPAALMQPGRIEVGHGQAVGVRHVVRQVQGRLGVCQGTVCIALQP